MKMQSIVLIAILCLSCSPSDMSPEQMDYHQPDDSVFTKSNWNTPCEITCGTSCPENCYSAASSRNNPSCSAEGNRSQTCASIPASGTITACGNFCPAGMYESASSRNNSSCPVEGNISHNCTTIPASGSFVVCGNLCPAGTYVSASATSGNCPVEGNSSNTCNLTPASGVITVCGNFCPAGFSEIGSSSSNRNCNLQGRRSVTCRR